MTHVTRHELTELVHQFKDKLIPKTSSLGMSGIHYQGITCVENELKKTTGPLSPRLRSYAHALKHFLSAKESAGLLNQANAAILDIERGRTSSAAIKRSRHWKRNLLSISPYPADFDGDALNIGDALYIPSCQCQLTQGVNKCGSVCLYCDTIVGTFSANKEQISEPNTVSVDCARD